MPLVRLRKAPLRLIGVAAVLIGAVAWWVLTPDLKPSQERQQLGDMREMLFAVKPSDLGITQGKEFPNVWGTIAEFNWDGDVTLFALGDGTVSLYTGGGFGVIGGGQHEHIRGMGRDLIRKSEEFLLQAKPAVGHPVAARGTVRFTFLTFDGPRVVVTDEDDLEEGQSPMSPLHEQFQALLGEIRKKSGG